MDATPALILTIDDEASIRESFRHYLEDYDYRVIEAADGQAGVELFRRHRPDLILVDLRMPELDGLEVLDIISKESPETPILVVSGTGIISDAIEAIHRGTWNYLLKPIEDLSILKHAIEKGLERARLIRENREYRTQLEEKVALRTRQLEETNRQLEETRLHVIRGLGRASEFRDNDSGKHVIRVSKYARILAKASGLSPQQVDLIHLSSPMHDIGKIGIPDHILLKADRLDAKEWAFMQQHCAIGVEILNSIPDDEIECYRQHTLQGSDYFAETEDSELLRCAKSIAASHHERWDGTGYPQGLQGTEIPLEARIVALADMYDTLSSPRVYKPSFDENTCQRQIREASGSYLDPQLVELFFSNINGFLAIKTKWAD